MLTALRRAVARGLLTLAAQLDPRTPPPADPLAEALSRPLHDALVLPYDIRIVPNLKSWGPDVTALMRLRVADRPLAAMEEWMSSRIPYIRLNLGSPGSRLMRVRLDRLCEESGLPGRSPVRMEPEEFAAACQEIARRRRVMLGACAEA